MFGKRGHRIDAVSQSDRARPISPGRCETARQWQLSHSRKAQLTVFIIVGLVLIVTAGLGIYLTSSKVQLEEKRAAVPAEQRPVYDFVVNCVQDRAREAINIMGQQGGYLEIPSQIERNPASYVAADPAAIVKIPDWYYLEQDRSPSITGMEKDISGFVEENLRECLNEFADFPQFKITELGNISAQTTLAEGNVVVELSYPISVEGEGRTERIDSYIIAVPARLKQMFDLAQRFMQNENKNKILEQATIDLMGLNDNIPMDGLDTDCSVKRWLMSDVKQQLQDTLKNHAQLFRIKNTVYAPFVSDEKTYEKLTNYAPDDIAPKELGGPGKKPSQSLLDQTPDAYEYFMLMFDIGQPSTDLRASFIYLPEWGLSMDAEPNDGGVLKSNIGKVNNLIPFLCANQYHFVYNVNYPIVIRLKDDKAFENTGFIFQFATPVIISSNQGKRISTNLQRLDSREFPDEFCTTLSDSFLDLRAEGLEQGYPEELNDVKMSFQCFSQLCSLGSTQPDPDAGARRLVKRLPEGCTNGFIVAEKEGYIATRKQITPEAAQQGTLVVPMTALKKMNVKVMKQTYYAPTASWLSQEPEELGDNEAASILITAPGTEFEQRIEYPEQKTAELIMDNINYDLTILLKLFERQTGGYNGNNVYVSFNSVDSSDTVVFNVFEYVPQNFDDQYYTDVVNFMYNGNYQGQLKPEFEETGAIIE